MKKSLSILLIIIAFMLIGCGPQNEGSVQKPISFSEYFKTLNGDVGSKTVFDLKITGDEEKTFGYSIERFDDCYAFNVWDGDSEEFTSNTLADGIKKYNDGCERESYNGNLRDIVFLHCSDLFNFDNAVRTVNTKNLSNGTTVYTPEVYESKVKDVFICFKNIFEVVDDVINMSLSLEEAGTKATVTVEMKAKYKGWQAPADVKLTVTHTKTIKVVD